MKSYVILCETIKLYFKRFLTRLYVGNIGQAATCSACLGMDSHNPHRHSWPRAAVLPGLGGPA